ncbi:MAG: threonine/serine exporter family protein [Bacillota bacterium]|nr:threonine/serine exporter family protein [Bacillota bacterium]
MIYILQFIYSFFATLSFNVLLQAPKRVYIINSTIGAFSWIIYKYIVSISQQTVLASMICGLYIGFFAGIFAIIKKIPAITIYLPSLIPLVPGSGIYYTMYYFISQDFEGASSKGVETILMAISLAAGIFITTNIVNIFNKIYRLKIKHQ